MSNIKRIEIRGDIPFNCYEQEDMLRFLGQMNAPIFGFKITYDGCYYQPNDNGGKTCMYHYGIKGEEAVRIGWVEALIKAILDCGGTATEIFVADIEAPQSFKWNGTKLVCT